MWTDSFSVVRKPRTKMGNEPESVECFKEFSYVRDSFKLSKFQLRFVRDEDNLSDALSKYNAACSMKNRALVRMLETGFINPVFEEA